MEKQAVKIATSEAIMHAITLVIIQSVAREIPSENIYLEAFRETISVCLT